jgi:hypothetical protein
MFVDITSRGMKDWRSSRRRRAKVSGEIVFDNLTATATTQGTSATLTVHGYLVAAADVGRYLAIRGGPNFIIGTYIIKSIDARLNTWTLDRHCATGNGSEMTGALVTRRGRWYDPVPEYFNPDLSNNPGQGEARELVLKALNYVEPAILISLEQTCCRRELLDPAVKGDHDWCGPFGDLLWGHVKGAGNVIYSGSSG